jgi:uncharacterized membrane protein
VNVIHGLPAHVLLNHFVVVLAPLTALLEIVCGLWPAARRRLVWLVLILAAVTMAVTPLTINTGWWLYDLRKAPDDILRTHAARGSWMLYFSIALLVMAIVLTALHLLESRSDKRRLAANTVVAILALAVGISTIIQVYRIGDAGAQSVWGGEIEKLKSHNGGD